MANVVCYAVDLADLTGWVGREDLRAVDAVRTALREDEEADWEPQELELLDRLLDRVVMQGQLYEDLAREERYYLTQLLIDIFDEFVDPEAVTEEWPLGLLEEALAPLLRGGGPVAGLAGYLSRGRELGGDAFLRPGNEPPDDLLPYFGYVSLAELPALRDAIEAVAGGGRRSRSSTALNELARACRLCMESERDLLAFVG